MNRYLLLILLSSWSLLVINSEECDTGVAFTNSILSVGRSSLANADVALLESYTAQTVEKCMEDCCSGKYGACTVASFKKNATKNCLHFNCRPLKQCKFLSSNNTDSFTFSSSPHSSHPVPSTSVLTSTSTTTQVPNTTPKAKLSIEQPHAVEEIATFSEEQDDLRNDNTSIKPRKGVAALSPDVILNKSGIKPRKGVTIEDVPHSKYLLKGLNKSNVKPRKGVGTLSSVEIFRGVENFTNSLSQFASNESFKIHNSSNDELALELAKLFEDDTLTSSSVSSTSSQTSTSQLNTVPPISISNHSTIIEEHSLSSKIHATITDLPSTTEFKFSNKPSSSSPLPVDPNSKLDISTTSEHSSVSAPVASVVPSLSARTHLVMDEPNVLQMALPSESQESDKDKKYKSSIHLVLSLVFGLLVLFAVLGVVAKRMYDGWQRRDYYRMNYLIDGIYNGIE